MHPPYQCAACDLNFYSARIRLSVKMNDEYKDVKELPAPLLAQQGPVGPARPKEQRKAITAGRVYHLLVCKPPDTHSSNSELGHKSHDRANRQYSCRATLYVHVFQQPSHRPPTPQNDTNHQAYLPPTMETRSCHFWALGLGAECCGRTRKQVVCYGCGRPCHQDLGPSLGRAQAVINGSHLDRAWLGGLAAAPIPLFMWRGQGK